MAVSSGPPAYLPTSQSLQIVPFFPTCLDLYPDALKFFNETGDLLANHALQKVNDSRSLIVYRRGNMSEEKKYHFTRFNTPSVSISRSKLCLAWVLTLDSVHVWECALRYYTEQHIQSEQNPEQLQLEESLLTDYRRWLVGARAITAALHTLHNWEINHFLPNAWSSACDAHSKELIKQFGCFADRVGDQILTSSLEQMNTIPADIFIRSKEIVKMYNKGYIYGWGLGNVFEILTKGSEKYLPSRTLSRSGHLLSWVDDLPQNHIPSDEDHHVDKTLPHQKGQSLQHIHRASNKDYYDRQKKKTKDERKSAGKARRVKYELRRVTEAFRKWSVPLKCGKLCQVMHMGVPLNGKEGGDVFRVNITYISLFDPTFVFYQYQLTGRILTHLNTAIRTSRQYRST
ncbi:hypothetical protein I308_105020 [Cryptococcus tetragattii IND107]|uniref:Uncharacterized protein n=1 Tax=Cryptococcus tetragattii IND107 TaxID=1296105 RepID=A0ABR3BLT7_9TREE